MKIKFYLMPLLLLLFFVSEIKSSYDNNYLGNDIESLFEPLQDINHILNFFGENMDDKVNDISQESKKLQKYDYHSKLVYNYTYLANKDFFPDLEKHRYHRTCYENLKNQIKKLDCKNISFLGLKNILYNENITRGQLFLTRSGILQCNDEYFMMQRGLVLLSSKKKYGNVPRQHFTITKVESGEPYFFLDKNGKMYIKHARDSSEKDEYVPFNILEHDTKKALKRSGPVKEFDLLVKSELVSISSQEMFIGIRNVLSRSYLQGSPTKDFEFSHSYIPIEQQDLFLNGLSPMHSYMNLIPNTVSRILFQEMQKDMSVHQNISHDSRILNISGNGIPGTIDEYCFDFDTETSKNTELYDVLCPEGGHKCTFEKESLYLNCDIVFCNQCNNIVHEFFHCDQCVGYDICFNCVKQTAEQNTELYDVLCPEGGHKCTFEKESPYLNDNVFCNQCNNLVHEFFHCDQCIGYDICLNCVKQTTEQEPNRLN